MKYRCFPSTAVWGSCAPCHSLGLKPSSRLQAMLSSAAMRQPGSDLKSITRKQARIFYAWFSPGIQPDFVANRVVLNRYNLPRKMCFASSNLTQSTVCSQPYRSETFYAHELFCICICTWNFLHKAVSSISNVLIAQAMISVYNLVLAVISK